jgi:hypothetical protein
MRRFHRRNEKNLLPFMKNQIHLLIFVAFAIQAAAQTNVFPSTGNVGIGTTAPAALLHVSGNNSTRVLLDNGVMLSQKNVSGSIRNLLSHYSDDNVYLDNPDGGIFLRTTTTGLLVDSRGNVGVGTANPGQKLSIQAGHTDTQLRLFSDAYGQGVNGANTSILSLWASEPGWTWDGVGIGNNVVNSGGIVRVTTTRGGSYMRLLNNQIFLNTIDSQGVDRSAIVVNEGNVGIGTTSITSRLTVDGGFLEMRSGNDLMLRPSGNGWDYRLRAVGTRFDIISGGDLANPKLSVEASGNVGIGTTNPTQKLSVNGTIRAKEVIVDTGWSDYVFDANYRLAPLSEVEARIKAEKHLPGIPSAAEIDAGGVSLGDMQSRLLAKIEELTLHQIALEKQLVAQAARLENLEQENAGLRTDAKP